MLTHGGSSGREFQMKNVCLMLALTHPLILGACASVPVVARDTSLPQNTELLIGEYGFWRRDCTDRHFDILIEQYPESGDLRFEVGSLIIPEDPEFGSAGNCVGERVQSKKVIYVANPDFVGQDSVTYVVKSTMFLGSTVYDLNIDVR